MTKQELLQLINDRAANDSEFAALVATRNDVAIASALSTGRKKVVSKIGGIGTIMDTLGTEEGANVLDTLNTIKEANRAVFWGWKLLETGGLDFGLPSTRGMIDSLVLAGAISPENGEAIKAVALEDDPISDMDVRRAIWADDGTYLPQEN